MKHTSTLLAALLAATATMAAENPVGPEDLKCDEILFVKRMPYSSDHNYTDVENGTSPDRFKPNNGIYAYNVRARQERAVVKAADMPGGKGFIGKISLSFDAKKVVFDFRTDAGSAFRIWEVRVDGSGLRQVSFPPSDEAEKAARWRPGWHTDDAHPCYLPGGKIVFSSSRCERTVLCGSSSSLLASSLYVMNADGSQVEPLTHSQLSEFCPVVLDDGRIMYQRWEYVDRGARVSKVIYVMNPDGTMPQELYGLANDDTTVYTYPQPLPCGSSRFVCAGACHFPQGGCLGAILLVDYGLGIRTRGPDPDEPGYVQGDKQYPVVNITPEVFVARKSEPGWKFRMPDATYKQDRNGQSGHLYTHPFPVSDKEFLVSYKVKPEDHYKNVANAYALYLIDTEGHKRAVFADPELSCWHATPVLVRPEPPMVATPRNQKYAAEKQAVCLLADIYKGMEGVKVGEVKWLRINEAIPRYWSTGRPWRPYANSGSWKAALWPRAQWGVVPVEADGSAHFLVPANRAIFFQALDANYREIQRERTYVNYAPGEMRSCTGCHGQSGMNVTQQKGTVPLAMQRAPSVPQPQPCDLKENGGTGLAGQVIHFPTDIQPIFDAKCVKCHGGQTPSGNLKLTGTVTDFYSTAYEELAIKELAGPLISEFTSFKRGDQGNYNGAYLPPRSLGCPQSVMISLLTDPKHPKNAKDNHTKLLTELELMVLGRWVDSNYQFYGSFWGRHHAKWQVVDPKFPVYDTKDFRRKATFDEAVDSKAPLWHR